MNTTESLVTLGSKMKNVRGLHFSLTHGDGDSRGLSDRRALPTRMQNGLTENMRCFFYEVSIMCALVHEIISCLFTTAVPAH